jgi:hypothetical protein
MAEPGPVDRNDPVASGQLIEEAADHEILGHGPVAVQQDHRPSLASGDVVDPHSINLDKPARWATGLLGLQGLRRSCGSPDSLAAL